MGNHDGEPARRPRTRFPGAEPGRRPERSPVRQCGDRLRRDRDRALNRRTRRAPSRATAVVAVTAGSDPDDSGFALQHWVKCGPKIASVIVHGAAPSVLLRSRSIVLLTILFFGACGGDDVCIATRPWRRRGRSPRSRRCFITAILRFPSAPRSKTRGCWGCCQSWSNRASSTCRPPSRSSEPFTASFLRRRCPRELQSSIDTLQRSSCQCEAPRRDVLRR